MIVTNLEDLKKGDVIARSSAYGGYFDILVVEGHTLWSVLCRCLLAPVTSGMGGGRRRLLNKGKGPGSRSRIYALGAPRPNTLLHPRIIRLDPDDIPEPYKSNL